MCENKEETACETVTLYWCLPFAREYLFGDREQMTVYTQCVGWFASTVGRLPVGTHELVVILCRAYQQPERTATGDRAHPERTATAGADLFVQSGPKVLEFMLEKLSGNRAVGVK